MEDKKKCLEMAIETLKNCTYSKAEDITTWIIATATRFEKYIGK